MRTLRLVTFSPSVLLLCVSMLACSRQQEVPRAVTPKALRQINKREVDAPESASPHYVSAPVIQEKATLKFNVVLDGPVPKREKLKVNGAVCGNLNIQSEKMVVGKGGAIENFLVYFDVRKNKGVKLPKFPVPQKQAVLDNKGCVFVPHILPVRAGQNFVVTNSDAEGHNAKFAFFENKEQNPLVPPKGKTAIPVPNAEIAPTPVSCNIHTWMEAYVVVFDHPYLSISDENGEIEIQDLPVGKLTFKLWHENQARSIDEGVLNGEKGKWRRGNIEIDLKPGMNDLGILKIPADKFK